MKLRQNIADFFKVLSADEELCRLLAYKPKNALDNPLSPTKPNVLTSSEYHSLISQRLLMSPKTNDLDSTPMNRICIYLGHRSNQSGSWEVKNQDVVIDVYSHIDDFDAVDTRCLWICEKINELVENKHITGIGKVFNQNIYVIPNAPSGYIGYKMIYHIGSGRR